MGRNREDGDSVLNVERHVPGYIIYSRYQMYENGVDTSTGTPVSVYKIGKQLPTGREEDIEETHLPHIPVFHVPYKSIDDEFFGIGGLEKLETVFAAINDRLVQIDYILWKHSDPTAYGPEIQDDGNTVQFGGAYIPVGKEDVTPGYMVWQAQLDAAFKELDVLFSNVFMMSETPQWLLELRCQATIQAEQVRHTQTAQRLKPVSCRFSRK